MSATINSILQTLKAAAVVGVLLLSLLPSHARASPRGYTNVTYPKNTVNPIGSASLTFSAKAQATYSLKAGGIAVDPNYEKNVKTYFAFVSPANRSLETLKGVNYEDFEGVLKIPKGTTLDTEDAFGPYGKFQGMLNILIGNKIMGGGACNTNGMTAMLLWYTGWFDVKITCLGHPAMPGIEDKFWITVESGTGCTVLATNVAGKDLYMHWRVIGDALTLWVDENPEMSGTAPAPAAISPGSAGVQPAAGLNDLPIIPVDFTTEIMSEDTVFGVTGEVPGQQNTAQPAPTTTTTIQIAPQPSRPTVPLPLYLGGLQLAIDFSWLWKVMLLLIVFVGIVTIYKLYNRFK